MANAPDLDVGYVAKLARLDLTADEIALFGAQLAQILQYADQLRAVEVSEVESAAHAVPLFDVVREDEPRDWFTAEQALANAPRAADGLFMVPKVVE